MKIFETIKSNITYLQLFAMILFWLMALALMQIINNEEKVIDKLEKERNIYKDSCTHYNDIYNTEHATKILITCEKTDLKLLLGKKIDSITKRLKISQKNIIALQEAIASANGEFEAEIKYIHDTLHEIATTYVHDSGLNDAGVFQYSEKYFSEIGEIYKDSIHIRYNVDIPITITEYHKRKWLLGEKQYFIDGYSDNKHAHITGLNGIQIAKHKQYLGIKIGGAVLVGIIFGRMI